MGKTHAALAALAAPCQCTPLIPYGPTAQTRGGGGNPLPVSCLSSRGAPSEQGGGSAPITPSLPAAQTPARPRRRRPIVIVERSTRATWKGRSR